MANANLVGDGTSLSQEFGAEMRDIYIAIGDPNVVDRPLTTADEDPILGLDQSGEITDAPMLTDDDVGNGGELEKLKHQLIEHRRFINYILPMVAMKKRKFIEHQKQLLFDEKGIITSLLINIIYECSGTLVWIWTRSALSLRLRRCSTVTVDRWNILLPSGAFRL